MHHIMAHWSEMRHACHACQTLQAQWLHKGFVAVERGTAEEDYNFVHMIAFNVIKRPRSSTIRFHVALYGFDGTTYVYPGSVCPIHWTNAEFLFMTC